MGKSKPPTPPDPKETAAAQTGTNINTAMANTYLGNVNQSTPDGTLTYSYDGPGHFIADSGGQTYYTDGKQYTTQKPPNMNGWQTATGFYTPQITATQKLSDKQQAIKDQNNETNLNLATLASNQSSRLDKLLSNPFSLAGGPPAGDPTKLQAPNYQQFGAGPKLQTQLGNAGNIQGSVGNGGDITKTYGTDYGKNVQEVQDTLMARMQPGLDQDRAALETRLANQGVQIGSAAYDAAMNNFNQQTNDARYGAILNAGQEQSRLAGLAQNQAAFQNSAQAQAYQQGLSSAQFANSAQQQQYDQNANNAQFSNSANQQMFANQNQTTAGNNTLEDQRFNSQQAIMNAQNQARSQWMNEQFAARNQPLNEISGLLSGAQISNPNFVPTQSASIPTVDYSGLVQQNYANQMGAYNAQQQQTQGLLGGLFGLGSSMIMKSDRRVKEDIHKVGEVDGENIYRFRYKSGGPMQLGVMAQEVEKGHPEAVREIGGIKHVDYGRLFSLGDRA